MKEERQFPFTIYVYRVGSSPPKRKNKGKSQSLVPDTTIYDALMFSFFSVEQTAFFYVRTYWENTLAIIPFPIVPAHVVVYIYPVSKPHTYLPTYLRGKLLSSSNNCKEPDLKKWIFSRRKPKLSITTPDCKLSIWKGRKKEWKGLKERRFSSPEKSFLEENSLLCTAQTIQAGKEGKKERKKERDTYLPSGFRFKSKLSRVSMCMMIWVRGWEILTEGLLFSLNSAALLEENLAKYCSAVCVAFNMLHIRIV